jgi:HD-GYP domain-containing protein (c-di-GMP phosphodiesterase class II)
MAGEKGGGLESLDELVEETAEEPKKDISAELRLWNARYDDQQIPCLFLDRSLKIVRANRSFYQLFGVNADLPGTYFTRFYSPYFDDKRSSELYRGILSPQKGFSWNGKVEKIGRDELLNVLKVWITPVRSALPAAGAPVEAPRAYSALCLDMTDEYRHLLQTTFQSLLGAARLKDNDTGNHIERVNRYSRALATSLLKLPEYREVTRQFIDAIGLVAALHDVGKIGTPDDILNKAGPLEAWEWEIMKQHTTNGAYILGTYPNPMAREIALRHHERWDGSGYPHGLSENFIPLCAQIVSLCDVYDALRMWRTYKEPYTHARTLEIMNKEKGTHFSPALTDRFLAISAQFDKIFTELIDTQ